MAYADIVFKEMCRDIIDNGTDTTGELVRPIWEDTGEKAYTIKKFGVVNRYDLRKEFPILTLRPTGMKSALKELLWIWQQKSNNVNDLHPLAIWDSWADESGSIGKAYGYQVGQKYNHHKISDEEIKKLNPSVNNVLINDPIYKEYPSFSINEYNLPTDDKYVALDQIDSVIWDLRHNPYSRRIITNLYNHQDLFEMGLYPCAYMMTFNVTKDKDSDKLILNLMLNQRSQDVLAANNWNVVQYSLMLHMMAQCCNMIVGELVHVIADCHIYDRHIPIIEELISREAYPAPTLIINPDIKNFYDFTVNDFELENYQHGPQITNIPIAV